MSGAAAEVHSGKVGLLSPAACLHLGAAAGSQSDASEETFDFCRSINTPIASRWRTSLPEGGAINNEEGRMRRRGGGAQHRQINTITSTLKMQGR